MTELVLTAYDVQNYLREALPALRAAIYRGDLSQAKDALAVYDETIYGEWDLSQALVEKDYSWIFTEQAASSETMDPEGTLVGLVYPLILAYHHPDLFRVRFGGSELGPLLPLVRESDSTTNGSVPVSPGFQEGLRAMWEITGYLTPQATETLRRYCLEMAQQGASGSARLLSQFATGLKTVVDHGYGLVVERD